MSNSGQKSKKTGCGCFFPMLLLFGAAYGWFGFLGRPVPKVEGLLQMWRDGQAWVGPILGWESQELDSPPVESGQLAKDLKPEMQEPVRPQTVNEPLSHQDKQAPEMEPSSQTTPSASKKASNATGVRVQSPWEKKAVRGIYLSRYQITNNTSESTIRGRVRYYKSQGFNTILHGVWGNGCTMYRSQVMQRQLGMPSCPNLFRDQWLD